MSKKCEQYMNIFLALDKHQRIPFPVSLHLLTCKKCRSMVILLTQAEKKASKEYAKQTSIDNKTIATIMNTIESEHAIDAKNNIPQVSMLKWILSGIFIFLALIVFSLSADNSLNQGTYALTATIFTVIATGYCSFFVASNLNFFIKQIETHLPISKGFLE